MESEDYPFFQGLVYLLENDVSTLGYELTFSTEVGICSLNAPIRFKWKIDFHGLIISLTVQIAIGPQGFESYFPYIIILRADLKRGGLSHAHLSICHWSMFFIKPLDLPIAMHKYIYSTHCETKT